MDMMEEQLSTGSINPEAIRTILDGVYDRIRESTGVSNPVICEARLHTLLYLVDVEYVREHGETLTGLSYVRRDDFFIEGCPCDGCRISRAGVPNIDES